MKHSAFVILMLFVLMFALALPVCAAEEAAGGGAVTTAAENAEDTLKSTKAWAAAALIGLAAIGGTAGMAWAIAKATGDIARQPEAAGSIRTAMMLGLVFIETVVIYALIVAILLVFVL